MPIRWQCPQAVRTRVYTSKSDVYSFGVLLFEICSGGATPFSELRVDEVLTAVEGGHRLKLPAGVDVDLKNLIYRCTTMTVAHRPSMSLITLQLEQRCCRHSELDPARAASDKTVIDNFDEDVGEETEL